MIDARVAQEHRNEDVTTPGGFISLKQVCHLAVI